jgi:hypothetical protein
LFDDGQEHARAVLDPAGLRLEAAAGQDLDDLPLQDR